MSTFKSVILTVAGTLSLLGASAGFADVYAKRDVDDFTGKVTLSAGAGTDSSFRNSLIVFKYENGNTVLSVNTNTYLGLGSGNKYEKPVKLMIKTDTGIKKYTLQSNKGFYFTTNKMAIEHVLSAEGDLPVRIVGYKTANFTLDMEDLSKNPLIDEILK